MSRAPYILADPLPSVEELAAAWARMRPGQRLPLRCTPRMVFDILLAVNRNRLEHEVNRQRGLALDDGEL